MNRIKIASNLITFLNKVNDQMSNEANKYSPLRLQSHIDIWIAFLYKKLIIFF